MKEIDLRIEMRWTSLNWSAIEAIVNEAILEVLGILTD